MQITYGGIVLTGIGPEQPSGLSFNGAPVVQIEELARATDILILDRLRKRNEVSWSVTRQHANLGAAEQFMLTHADSLPNKGTLKIVVQGDGGQPSGTRTFAQATVAASTVMDGVTTLTQYSATCGKGTA
jgi:hypothetical protein